MNFESKYYFQQNGDWNIHTNLSSPLEAVMLKQEKSESGTIHSERIQQEW